MILKILLLQKIHATYPTTQLLIRILKAIFAGLRIYPQITIIASPLIYTNNQLPLQTYVEISKKFEINHTSLTFLIFFHLFYLYFLDNTTFSI